MLTLQDIQTILSEEIEKLHSINIFPVRINSVSLVSAKSFYADANRGLGRIRVSKYYLDADPQEIRATMMHELLHLVPEAGHGHGREWQNLAAHVNMSFPQYSIKRCGTQLAGGTSFSLRNAANAAAKAEGKLVRQYVVECPTCHTYWTRTRQSRLTLHPESYSCGKCHTPLQRVK